jgi:hypothetical protein
MSRAPAPGRANISSRSPAASTAARFRLVIAPYGATSRVAASRRVVIRQVLDRREHLAGPGVSRHGGHRAEQELPAEQGPVQGSPGSARPRPWPVSVAGGRMRMSSTGASVSSFVLEQNISFPFTGTERNDLFHD